MKYLIAILFSFSVYANAELGSGNRFSEQEDSIAIMSDISDEILELYYDDKGNLNMRIWDLSTATPTQAIISRYFAVKMEEALGEAFTLQLIAEGAKKEMYQDLLMFKTVDSESTVRMFFASNTYPHSNKMHSFVSICVSKSKRKACFGTAYVRELGVSLKRALEQ